MLQMENAEEAKRFLAEKPERTAADSSGDDDEDAAESKRAPAPILGSAQTGAASAPAAAAAHVGFAVPDFSTEDAVHLNLPKAHGTCVGCDHERKRYLFYFDGEWLCDEHLREKRAVADGGAMSAAHAAMPLPGQRVVRTAASTGLLARLQAAAGPSAVRTGPTHTAPPVSSQPVAAVPTTLHRPAAAQTLTAVRPAAATVPPTTTMQGATRTAPLHTATRPLGLVPGPLLAPPAAVSGPPASVLNAQGSFGPAVHAAASSASLFAQSPVDDGQRSLYERGFVAGVQAQIGTSGVALLSDEVKSGLELLTDATSTKQLLIAPGFCDRVRAHHNGSFVEWCERRTWKQLRNLNEARHQSRVLDQFVSEGANVSGKAMEFACRRLVGLELVDQSGNWDLMDYLQMAESSRSSLDADTLQRVLRGALAFSSTVSKAYGRQGGGGAAFGAASAEAYGDPMLAQHAQQPFAGGRGKGRPWKKQQSWQQSQSMHPVGHVPTMPMSLPMPAMHAGLQMPVYTAPSVPPTPPGYGFYTPMTAAGPQLRGPPFGGTHFLPQHMAGRGAGRGAPPQ